MAVRVGPRQWVERKFSMAVVAEGPSEERNSQQEVTLVPQASHRMVSMGTPRWVWSVVGDEIPRRAM
jgi:hypothetical protein